MRVREHSKPTERLLACDPLGYLTYCCKQELTLNPRPSTLNPPALSASSQPSSSDPPASESGFSDLGLSDIMLASLARAGYEAPTPVQAGIIPRARARQLLDRHLRLQDSRFRDLHRTDPNSRKGARCTGARCKGGSRVQGCTGARQVQGCRGAGVQRCKGAKVQGARVQARRRSWPAICSRRRHGSEGL